MQISKSDIDQIINCAPNAIEPVLKLLQTKINVAKAKGGFPDLPAEKTSPVASSTKPAVQSKGSPSSGLSAPMYLEIMTLVL